MGSTGYNSLAGWLVTGVNFVWYATILFVSLGLVLGLVLFILGPPRAIVSVGILMDDGPEVVRPTTAEAPRLQVKDANATITFSSTRLGMLLLVLVPVLALLVPYLVAMDRLRGFLRTLEHGSPFTPENAKRLRAIGFSILAFQAIATLTRLVHGLYARQQFQLDGGTIRLGFDPGLSVIFLGCLFLVIAEAFRRGTLLEQDHDLTI